MSALAGRVAVVTGAASGIGRAVAERLAEEGATVVAVDRADGASTTAVCDVTRAGDVEELAALVRREHGRWDVLVNSAGVVVHGCAGETTDEDWQRVFDVNTRGTWLACRAALAAMLEGGGGAIVNIASGAGLRAVPRLAAYSASKAAVISLTRSIALEYGADGIRANCICPGLIDTPLSRETTSVLLGDSASPEEVLAPYALKRLGDAREIADAALFLASPASSYVTGATLAVDAGRTLH